MSRNSGNISTRRHRRAWLWLAQAGRCALCGADLRLREGTLDHIVPRVAGRDSRLANLQLTCARCNVRKGSSYYSRPCAAIRAALGHIYHREVT